MTLGRPTFGRRDPYTVDISLPRYGKSQSPPDMIINAFIANVDFCKLATEIQKRLAQSDPPFEDLADDDREGIVNCQKVSLEAIRNIACCMRPNSFWYGAVPGISTSPALSL
ncbi:hypothetical protein BDV34DRAFT_2756 [Aspergillus parasiticus]|uniref:Uncharacterized protein n=1 Tax=Aspergillus parasiticus TaxID=5067 RepID=A0A5N6E456_ASPPA|nr:hypothetical protein BDV34DRAFT_2756 [Aspergillus parasiticus]